jgi:multidrug efflux pump subunit AcrA (membrane-fusion protein)
MRTDPSKNGVLRLVRKDTPKDAPTEANPALLPPVRSDEFLPPIGVWAILGGLLPIATAVIILILAVSLQYKATVKSTATIRPVGETRLVQAAIAGSVKRILVKENQVVKQGQAIATIDDAELLTKQQQAIGNIENNELQLAQINAQLLSLKRQRDFESSFIERNIAAATAQLQRYQWEYQQRQIASQTQVKEATAVLELAKIELKQFEQLANTGAVTQLQVQEKEQAFVAAEAKLKGAKAALNPTGAAIAMATEQIAQQRAKAEISLANLNKDREVLLQRRLALENEIDRAQQELQQVQQELKKAVLLTPDAGKILKLELHTPGQVVSVGQSIAQIAPIHAALTIRAQVLAQDISNIQICQQPAVADCQAGKVQLRISGYPYPNYGMLRGAVRAISANALVPQTQLPNPALPYYEVTIQPERAYLVKGDRSYPLKAGMEVTAEIVTREETVLSFLLRKARLLTNL